MKIEILWAMVLVTSAFGAVVARDIPPGPDLEVDEVMIAEEENVMDYGNHTTDQNTNRQGNPGLVNVRCDFDGQYKPHPMTCSKFVQCSWLTPTEMTCPLDTVWFQSQLTCINSPTKNCDQIAPVSPSSPVDCSCGMARTSNRIIDGVEVKQGKYPWQVGLRHPDINGFEIFCGGSIINNRYVLTAAHCVYKLNRSQKPYVHIGAQNQDSIVFNNIKSVNQIIIHPCYDCITYDFDFALLELNHLVFTDDIKPVCLPEDDIKSYIGENATIAGWGLTDFKDKTSSSAELLEVDVTILDNNNCGNYDPGEITSNMLCAGDLKNGGKNSCTGDSGGPLVVKEQINGKTKYVQVGLVTGAKDCALKDYPTVFARVSKVLDWIRAKSAFGQYCAK